LAAWLAILTLAVVGCSGAAVTPSAVPSTGSARTLSIAYEENCQIELIASSGQRILIDVYDPNQLTSPATAADILLTTHLHTDHYNAAFEASFPGQKITNKAGELTLGDTEIKSIPASHDDEAIDTSDASNHIFVIEFNGFKIVHGGSTGQTELTPDQLAAIGGNVDVAALVLENVGGHENETNDKAIKIAQQINPRILIPTHTAAEYIQSMPKVWQATYSNNKTVTIPRDEVPTQTTVLFMGADGPLYGKYLNVPETKW
jgi:L-ascorbate metabolism protein UlaG (beta-lactamase superfamily)